MLSRQHGALRHRLGCARDRRGQADSPFTSCPPPQSRTCEPPVCVTVTADCVPTAEPGVQPGRHHPLRPDGEALAAVPTVHPAAPGAPACRGPARSPRCLETGPCSRQGVTPLPPPRRCGGRTGQAGWARVTVTPPAQPHVGFGWTLTPGVVQTPQAGWPVPRTRWQGGGPQISTLLSILACTLEAPTNPLRFPSS